MFAISFDVIDWEADTLLYENSDNTHFVSSKTSKATSTVKTTPIATTIEIIEVNITKNLNVKFV